MSNKEKKYLLLKAGISVYISVLITYFLFSNGFNFLNVNFDTFSIFIAGIAAAISSQTKKIDTIKVGYNRIYGTLVGSIIGFLATIVLNNLYVLRIPPILYIPLFAGLGTVISFYICQKIKGNPTQTVSAITFLGIIVLHSSGSTEDYIIGRFIATVIGVVTTHIVSIIIHKFLDEK